MGFPWNDADRAKEAEDGKRPMLLKSPFRPWDDAADAAGEKTEELKRKSGLGSALAAAWESTTVDRAAPVASAMGRPQRGAHGGAASEGCDAVASPPPSPWARRVRLGCPAWGGLRDRHVGGVSRPPPPWQLSRLPPVPSQHLSTACPGPRK